MSPELLQDDPDAYDLILKLGDRIPILGAQIADASKSEALQDFAAAERLMDHLHGLPGSGLIHDLGQQIRKVVSHLN